MSRIRRSLGRTGSGRIGRNRWRWGRRRWINGLRICTIALAELKCGTSRSRCTVSKCTASRWSTSRRPKWKCSAKWRCSWNWKCLSKLKRMPPGSLGYQMLKICTECNDKCRNSYNLFGLWLFIFCFFIFISDRWGSIKLSKLLKWNEGYVWKLCFLFIEWTKSQT